MIQKVPANKTIRGSYFPQIPKFGALHTVETVGGQTLYCGYSEHVARLINACMSPRVA